ncbi:hypothetical protein COBT_001460 [Conglomerata obtusa]
MQENAKNELYMVEKCLETVNINSTDFDFSSLQNNFIDTAKNRKLFFDDQYIIWINNEIKLCYLILSTSEMSNYEWKEELETIDNINVCKYIINPINHDDKYKYKDRIFQIENIIQPLSAQALCDAKNHAYIGNIDTDYDITDIAKLGVIKNITRDVLNALKCLHANFIAHTMISPKHILVSKENDKLVYKLLLLSGMKSFVSEAKNKPNVSQSNQQIWDLYCKSDVWHLGKTALILFLGFDYLMESVDGEKKFDRIKNDIVGFLKEKKINGDFEDFLINCLNTDPRKRKSVQELLQHRFLI